MNRKKQLDFAWIRYWLVSTQAFLSLSSFTLALRFSGRDLDFFFQQQPWKNPIWTPILQHSFFLLLYNNNNNNLTIIILSLFTLGSIYSTYASGTEKMTETKSWNQTINRFKNPATGRRQTSWLFTSLVEDLNSGRLWRSASGQNSGNPRPPNYKSGVLTDWPRCPLPFSSLCVHFFLSFSYTVMIVALVRPRTFRRFCLNLFIDNWLQIFSSQVLANPGSYIFPKNCRNQVDWAILDLNTIFWAFVTYWREITVKSWTR